MVQAAFGAEDSEQAGELLEWAATAQPDATADALWAFWKAPPEGAPAAGEGAPKGGRKEGKITLSERAKLRWPTRPTEVKRA